MKCFAEHEQDRTCSAFTSIGADVTAQQLWLNPHNRNISSITEILEIFSGWQWSMMLSAGPDLMSSSVTGVNCPSCSLPYDRWDHNHQFQTFPDKTNPWCNFDRVKHVGWLKTASDTAVIVSKAAVLLVVLCCLKGYEFDKTIKTLCFRSQRRCLIDSCGHERCFSCIFLSQTQTCPLCLLSLTGEGIINIIREKESVREKITFNSSR